MGAASPQDNALNHPAQDRYAFPSIGLLDGELATNLTQTCERLDELGGTARAAAERLYLAGHDYAQFTPAGLYTFMDPIGTSNAVEHEQGRFIQELSTARNALVLLPLVFTWFGLFWATSQFQADIVKYPNDKNVPFLQLWEQGFHDSHSVFIFSNFAIADVVLFLLLIAAGIVTDWMFRRARAASTEVRRRLEVAVRGLSKLVLPMMRGVTPATASDDWAKQMRELIQETNVVARRLGEMMLEMRQPPRPSITNDSKPVKLP